MNTQTKILDVGCGPNKVAGAVGIDILALPGVDVVPGGVVYIRVPHANCCTTAWADPTHKRFAARSDHYRFGIDFRIRKRRLHYFLYEGVRNGEVLQRLPLWKGLRKCTLNLPPTRIRNDDAA